ncbi:MAG: glucose-6-phosphate dehydrogenase [Alphaproteobacteria bacterium]|nr:glucose-6-phosphate dehydrogenase [Alphaproteobacteria bacterium]MBL6938494.1 glucose-6-phosphate dehydrogenase [Alphaproteobacteria bacterium]MBL7096553.1 glucose-6-phosphate dehydrogenase [Alphaproteobacteria bacterium]
MSEASRALVIFGGTGDLAQRMLFPSLYNLDADGLLPRDLLIVGCSRGAMSDEAFGDKVGDWAGARSGDHFTSAKWSALRGRIRHAAIDANAPASFANLKRVLGGIEETLFYLSTSPSHYGAICANLKAAGLAGPKSRVVVEKPIGRDLGSCREINDSLARTFAEGNIFRIDHYLGKEAVQNLLALRFANTLFEPLWNKVSIAQVQITVAETVGVEDRWGYYDEYGAIRDMVQNHLLQLLCLVAMEPPANLDPDSVRNEKVKVLLSLRPVSDVAKKTVRGQYSAGYAEGHTVAGYATEPGGHASDTETFVAIQANIDNWRWAGVPFYLRTGKRLPIRRSEIVIQFREVPHSVFAGNQLLANRLTITLQPEEEIALTLMNKTPDLEQMTLRPLGLNLSLSDTFKKARRRIAYERLLLEALHGKSTLFVRRDEAEAAWRWIDAIVSGWKKQGAPPAAYAAGSWGPSAAIALTERNGHSWNE